MVRISKGRKKSYAAFERMKGRLSVLLDDSGLRPRSRDRTLMVDLPSLYFKCVRIRTYIRELASTRARAGQTLVAEKRAGRLWAEIDDLGRYVRDLRAPLDRLHLRLSRKSRRGESSG